MNFKVGDKVLIKDWVVLQAIASAAGYDTPDGFLDNVPCNFERGECVGEIGLDHCHEAYCGKVFKIKHIEDYGGIKLGEWWWHPDFLIKV